MLAITCLFTPFVWLLLIDYPWNEYRWLWLSMYGVAPGLSPAQFVWVVWVTIFVQSPVSLGVLQGTAGVLTLIGFFVPVTIIRFRPKWTSFVLAATGAGAFCVSFLTYQLFVSQAIPFR